MKIEMQTGFEITEEIKEIAKYYNFNVHYINSYTQMQEVEKSNNEIIDKLIKLNVKTLSL